MPAPPIVAPRPLRLRVWAKRTRLDRALAGGTPPNASPELELRAAQLSRAATRRAIAAMLSNVLDAAEEPPSPAERQVPGQAVNRSAIAHARDELTTLIAGLRDDDAPASVQGIAQAHLLAVDSGGPLYGMAPPSELIAAVELAQTTLDISRYCRVRPDAVRFRNSGL